MDIEPSEIEIKEVVGQSKNDKVIYIKTVGGLHILLKASAVPEFLGIGPHRLVAKKIAHNKDPGIKFDFGELSKNEEIVNDSYFDLLVAKYDLLTYKINSKK